MLALAFSSKQSSTAGKCSVILQVHFADDTLIFSIKLQLIFVQPIHWLFVANEHHLQTQGNTFL